MDHNRPKSLFSLRLVSANYYLTKPSQHDVTYSVFRKCEVAVVPIVQAFGVTPAGQKACLHIHGIFPYIYIPLPEDVVQLSEYYLNQLAESLDLALNVALGKTNNTIQHIFKIDPIIAKRFYGYCESKKVFLKIFFYNPSACKRAAELLLTGAIMNTVFQPYESHVSFIMQVFIDYNLFGMNFLNINGGKVRLGSSAQCKPISPHSSPQYGNDESICHRHWDVNNLPSEFIDVHGNLPPATHCELELDTHASMILNKNELSSQSDGSDISNPGLVAIWEEEKQRRRMCGESSQLEDPPSPSRDAHVPTSSISSSRDFYKMLERHVEHVGTDNETSRIQVDGRNIMDKTTTPSLAKVNACNQSNRSVSQPVVDKEKIISLAQSSPSFTSTDGAERRLLVNMLESLKDIDEDSVLSQNTVKDDNDISDDDINLSQLLGGISSSTAHYYDDDESVSQGQNKSLNLVNNATSNSENLSISNEKVLKPSPVFSVHVAELTSSNHVMDECDIDESSPMLETSACGDEPLNGMDIESDISWESDVDIPQLDGAGDLIPKKKSKRNAAVQQERSNLDEREDADSSNSEDEIVGWFDFIGENVTKACEVVVEKLDMENEQHTNEEEKFDNKLNRRNASSDDDLKRPTTRRGRKGCDDDRSSKSSGKSQNKVCSCDKLSPYLEHLDDELLGHEVLQLSDISSTPHLMEWFDPSSSTTPQKPAGTLKEANDDKEDSECEFLINWVNKSSLAKNGSSSSSNTNNTKVKEKALLADAVAQKEENDHDEESDDDDDFLINWVNKSSLEKVMNTNNSTSDMVQESNTTVDCSCHTLSPFLNNSYVNDAKLGHEVLQVDDISKLSLSGDIRKDEVGLNTNGEEVEPIEESVQQSSNGDITDTLNRTPSGCTCEKLVPYLNKMSQDKKLGHEIISVPKVSLDLSEPKMSSISDVTLPSTSGESYRLRENISDCNSKKEWKSVASDNGKESKSKAISSKRGTGRKSKRPNAKVTENTQVYDRGLDSKDSFKLDLSYTRTTRTRAGKSGVFAKRGKQLTNSARDIKNKSKSVQPNNNARKRGPTVSSRRRGQTKKATGGTSKETYSQLVSSQDYSYDFNDTMFNLSYLSPEITNIGFPFNPAPINGNNEISYDIELTNDNMLWDDNDLMEENEDYVILANTSPVPKQTRTGSSKRKPHPRSLRELESCASPDLFVDMNSSGENKSSRPSHKETFMSHSKHIDDECSDLLTDVIECIDSSGSSIDTSKYMNWNKGARIPRHTGSDHNVVNSMSHTETVLIHPTITAPTRIDIEKSRQKYGIHEEIHDLPKCSDELDIPNKIR